MRRDEKKQRKKKKKEDARRAQRIAYNAQARRVLKAQAKYPDVIFNDAEGTPEFVTLIKDAQKRVDLDDPAVCPSQYRTAYCHIREKGIASFRSALFGTGPLSSQPGSAADAWFHEFMMHYGTAVFSHIPLEVRRLFLPYNEVFMHFRENLLFFEFSSLLVAPGRKHPIYYSRHKPRVRLGPSSWPVGFHEHAIEQAAARLNPNYLEYHCSADVHAFFAHCVYFEEVVLNSRSHPDQPAFSMFDTCNDPSFHSYHVYVDDVFGLNGTAPDRTKGDFYFRLGYFPVRFENGFATATTFLRPGYTGTPELHRLRDERHMPRDKKAFLLRESRQHKGREVLLGGRTEVIKWFHTNGCPQVVQFKHRVFDRSATLPDRPTVASTWLTRAKHLLKGIGGALKANGKRKR